MMIQLSKIGFCKYLDNRVIQMRARRGFTVERHFFSQDSNF